MEGTIDMAIDKDMLDRHRQLGYWLAGWVCAG